RERSLGQGLGALDLFLDQFVPVDLVLFLEGPYDQTGLPIESYVVVYPVDEHHDPILETDQEEKVYEHPNKPGEHALEPESVKVHNGLVPSNGGHAALVPVYKGFHGLSLE